MKLHRVEYGILLGIGVIAASLAYDYYRSKDTGPEAPSRERDPVRHSMASVSVSPSSSMEASGAGVLLQPAETGTIPGAGDASTPTAPGPVSAGPLMRDPVLFDEHYAPTKERWMSRGGSLLGALETTPDELRELPESFWMGHREWEYLLDQDFETLFDVLPIEVDMELELQWGDEANRYLWGEHQKIYREQDLALMALDEQLSPEAKRAAEMHLEVVRDRLEALRRALWSASPPAYFFLYELSKATR